MKILLVEDDADLREITTRSLEKERYIVETAVDYASAIQKVEDYEYDCILLDIMLPDGNGLDLLKHLSNIGLRRNVIIISAKDSIDDKVAGLDLGADDYLAKPFHLAELNARVKSVIRRNRSDFNANQSIKLGNVELHPNSFSVYVNDKNIELNRKEYDIFHYLINRPGRTIDKNLLAEAVWGDNIDQVDNFDFIYAQMKNLRKKLKEAQSSIEIKAVYGFGYKLVEL